MEESVHNSDLNFENSSGDDEFKSCCEEDQDWQDADESLDEEGIEESIRSSFRTTELFKESEKSILPLLEYSKDSGDSIMFTDRIEENASNGSLRLLEFYEREVVSNCLLCLSSGHDDNVLESFRMCERCEENISIFDHKRNASECSHGLFGNEEEADLDRALGFPRDQGDDLIESSPRSCEAHVDDISKSSSRLSECDDDLLERSLMFSEGHEDDILEPSAMLSENHDGDVDELVVRLFSKGSSVTENHGLGPRISGIGVVIDKPHGVPFLQVQKKLDFFVEELMAEHLALMDGLLEARRNGCLKVLAFTDSNKLYHLINKHDMIEDRLLIALQERIHELADEFESFALRLAPRSHLIRPLQLAQEAVGILSHFDRSACGENVKISEMIEMNYSKCQAPLHFPCEQYHNLPLEEQSVGDSALHQTALSNAWIRCRQCFQIIELGEGCRRVTCGCGHEFCFSCDTEYAYGTQMCRCFQEVSPPTSPPPSEHETELWRWDCFDPLPSTNISDCYTEQEKTQLALIQRFLAGGISLVDSHNFFESPPQSPDSYLDTMKDLNQLPWLESFISVIGDGYQEDQAY